MHLPATVNSLFVQTFMANKIPSESDCDSTGMENRLHTADKSGNEQHHTVFIPLGVSGDEVQRDLATLCAILLSLVQTRYQ